MHAAPGKFIMPLFFLSLSVSAAFVVIILYRNAYVYLTISVMDASVCVSVKQQEISRSIAAAAAAIAAAAIIAKKKLFHFDKYIVRTCTNKITQTNRIKIWNGRRM